ncbi:Large-conductance mechanosensitive channel [Beijerinckiaceae bacterium RH AL1]|nr:large conductance mechanosensitive channel protein MscL [Beijerinckiaceae bacterium]VVB47541.1 Large-conductance mechanosensitive channel [Beijerinckiaceae bacterium RH CH11]VVB47622.1 Large-conductance mechanosensitive channel [Beijerinckiaceae bacterium RH AL8]VVC55941.1 Large-conductance mechanosensitive channel [Beijerinckiaceae bacterium RH AL1]
MLKEFKDFIMRGNVVDLAVAVVIGAAFGAIVTSMVNDLIMPIVGAITGGVDFTNYFTPLSSKVTATTLADAKKQGAVLAWGNFLQMTVNFLIVAAVLFLVVKAMNTLKTRMSHPEEAAAPKKPDDVVLLEEIRDLLARRPA